jgi:hypothetical protein
MPPDSQARATAREVLAGADGRRRERSVVALVLMVVASLYLWPFIRRGWIPHDEGTIGLSAVRLLAGELPHLDFQDYTGGMTWFYAGLFDLLGVDLVWIRYALFGAALASVWVWYRIALRFSGSWPAAGAALTALAWSFPNYFAGLPSWWCVTFTSVAILLLIQYAERGALRALLLSGLALGLSCIFKQSGVYLVGASVLALLYWEQTASASGGPVSQPAGLVLVRVLTATCAAGGLYYVIRGVWSIEILVLLIAPIACVCLLLVADAWSRRDQAPPASPARLAAALVLLLSGVAVPLLTLAAPYVARQRLLELFHGAFGVPQQLKVIGYYRWPSLWLSVLLVPVTILIAKAAAQERKHWVLIGLAWLLPVAVLLSYGSNVGYLLAWNSIRSSAALLVVASCWLLWRRRSHASESERVLFVLTAATAFFALFQYPFAAPVYFCYVAPFAVLLAFAYLSMGGAGIMRLPVLGSVALFAVLSVNPGYVDQMGRSRRVVALNTELALPNASIRVGAEDAVVYRRVTSLVASHAASDTIYAAPDCPEVYYLTGRRNPTPANFDAFWPLTTAQVVQLWATRDIHLVVLNHKPQFSHVPSDELLLEARRTFPQSENVGHFEVRWR